LTALFLCQSSAAEDLVPSVVFAKDAELVHRTDHLISAVCEEMETSELRWNDRFHQHTNYDDTVTTGIHCELASRETGAVAAEDKQVGVVDICELSRPNVAALRTVLEIRHWSLPDGCDKGSREVARRMIPVLLAKARSAPCQQRPEPKECDMILHEYAYYKQTVLGQDPYKPDEETPDIPDNPRDKKTGGDSGLTGVMRNWGQHDN
jgi:hypothetical protein